MIQVVIGSNTTRDTEVCDPSTNTPRQLLEKYNVNYGASTVNIDGIPLGIGMMDKTFSELGITTKCFLSCVIKQDNN